VDLRIKLLEVRKYYPDRQFTEIGIDKHHVRVHVVISPKYSVSFAVETITRDKRGLNPERTPVCPGNPWKILLSCKAVFLWQVDLV